MQLGEIEKELSTKLNSCFKSKCYEFAYVEEYFPDKLIIFLDYSPNLSEPSYSFALSLDDYHNDKFLNKCWITSSSIRDIDGKIPDKESGKQYKEFIYRDKKFTPYSVDLSNYRPKDAKSIKILLNSLYKHINC